MMPNAKNKQETSFTIEEEAIEDIYKFVYLRNKIDHHGVQMKSSKQELRK